MSKSPLTRRDFLKLASLGAGAGALSRLAPQTLSHLQPAAEKPNILILVFDAMSARNLSLYGYPRPTSPNLERFADRSHVYHAHHSAASFTTPGVASLLTGLLPWSHGAINTGGLIAGKHADESLFKAIGKNYHRLAFSQNLWAHFLLDQFNGDLETLLPPESFSLMDQVIGSRLGGMKGAYRAFDDFLFEDGVVPASLLLGLADRLELQRRVDSAPLNDYARGLPSVSNYPIYFRLHEVFEGVAAAIESLPEPYLAYIHLWAPHAPYKPSDEFYRKFNDSWRPEPKPMHAMSPHRSEELLLRRRVRYDEYIANTDDEFGWLLDRLTDGGSLANTFVVVTSDHGEMLERGVEGHVTPLLYEPVVHVPLLISAPGQSARKDHHSPTNSVDLMPSLLTAVGTPASTWSSGQILPGLGGMEAEERSVFMVEAKRNSSFRVLKQATIAMQKGPYKLIYYAGYGSEDSFELYDLEADHEELHDLVPAKPSFLKPLQDELMEAFDAANSEIIQRHSQAIHTPSRAPGALV